MANRGTSLPRRDQWPVGFRFSPTDEELLDHYLNNKVSGNDSLVEHIPHIDVYQFEPWELHGRLSGDHRSVEKLFFFCALDFKISNGKRPTRLTKHGFWKSTGHDREIRARGTNRLIGTKKSLVYHRGRARAANRTNWVIHQYSLHTEAPSQNSSPFVVCCLKKKSDMKVAQFDGPNDLTTFENAITVNGIQESSSPSHCTGQPALPDSQSINASDYEPNCQYFDPVELQAMCTSPRQPALPDSQSINVSDYGVNWQSIQPEPTESYFDPDEFLNLFDSPGQPAFPDFQPHDDLMDFQPTNGMNGEVYNQLVQPGPSESEIDLVECLNSILENENDNEVTSRIYIDSYDREEPSNRLLGLQYDGFCRGTENIAHFWGQSNDVPQSRSYRCVGSTTKTIKYFQSIEEKEMYLHEALQGSSSGSIVSTRNVFSYIVTTKRIQHKSAHPLVYIAKAFLGIVLFVVLVLKLLRYGEFSC